MSTFEIYSNEIDDRFDSPFYEKSQVEIFRKLKAKYAVAKLGDILKTPNSITNGLEIRRFVKKGTPYLRASNVREIFATLTGAKRVETDLQKIPEKVRLRRGDVLIDRGGVYCGKVCLVTKDITNCIISADIKKIEFDESILPEYVVVYLNSKIGRAQIRRITQGGVMNKINNPSLMRVKVPIIPNADQEKIADIVGDAENKRIEANNKISCALRTLIRCIGIDASTDDKNTYSISSTDLQEMLTPKFYNPRYIDTFRKFSERFILKPLSKIAQIQRGKGTRIKQYTEEGIPFIRTSDIIDYEIDAFPDFYASESTYEEFNQPTEEGDILYTIEGKIGLSAMMLEGEKCVYKNHIERIRIKEDEDIDPYYVFLFLNTDFGLFQAYQRAVIQATMWGLSNKLREIRIPISPKEKDSVDEFEGNKQKAVGLAKEAFRLKKEKKKLIKEARQIIDEMMAS